MNYGKIYNNLIQRAQERVLEGYVEKHHIVPRCLGGLDEKSNLVQLTPEEHFLCHILLVKMNPQESGLILAVNMMSRPIACRKKRRLYGWLKRRFSEQMKMLQTGDGNSQFGTKWITDGITNKKVDINHKMVDGWYNGRILSRRSVAKKKIYKAISRNVDPFQILALYESGVGTAELATRYGWKSRHSVIMFLNSRFPNRKKFKPREQRNKTLS